MRYVIDIRVQRFLEGKRELLRNIENDSSVVLRFYDDRKLRQLKNNEIVCLVKGKLQNIQEATIKLF